MKQNGKKNYLAPVLAVGCLTKDVIVTSEPQEVGAEWIWGGAGE